MGCEQSRYLSFVEVAATLLLLIYPIAMLAVKGRMNAYPVDVVTCHGSIDGAAQSGLTL